MRVRMGIRMAYIVALFKQDLKNRVWVWPIVMTMKIGVHDRGFPGIRIMMRTRVQITQ